MADKSKLLFNGNPITEADALAALAKIYGPKRPQEILTGLDNGTYGCASVAGGYITLAPPAAEAPASDKKK